jgi:hypothetical protein
MNVERTIVHAVHTRETDERENMCIHRMNIRRTSNESDRQTNVHDEQ